MSRQTMDRFEQFLLETGDGAFAVDPQQRIVFWNGSRLQLWLSVFFIPSQWQDLWTVVHVLQRRPQALVPTLPDAPGAARCRENSADARTLTPREREILGMRALGHCVAEISRKFCLSPCTVRNHVQHVIGKLGLHSQLEAVAYAYRNDLV